MTRFTPLWLQDGTYPAQLDRHLIGAIWWGYVTQGLALTAVPGTMDIQISPGLAVLPSVAAGGVLCRSTATETVTVETEAPGWTRRDQIWVQARGSDIDVPGGTDFIFGVTKGNPAQLPASSTPNDNPPGAWQIGALTVVGGQANLDQVTVEDQRPGCLTRDDWYKQRWPRTQALLDVSGAIRLDIWNFEAFVVHPAGDVQFWWPNNQLQGRRIPNGSRFVVRVYSPNRVNLSWTEPFRGSDVAPLPNFVQGEMLIDFIFDAWHWPGSTTPEWWPAGSLVCVGVARY